jgi:hypothetical protein
MSLACVAVSASAHAYADAAGRRVAGADTAVRSTTHSQGDSSTLGGMQLSQLDRQRCDMAATLTARGQGQLLLRRVHSRGADQSQREPADGTEIAQNAATAPRPCPLSVGLRREEKSSEQRKGRPVWQRGQTKKEKKRERERREKEKVASADEQQRERRVVAPPGALRLPTALRCHLTSLIAALRCVRSRPPRCSIPHSAVIFPHRYLPSCIAMLEGVLERLLLKLFGEYVEVSRCPLPSLCSSRRVAWLCCLPIALSCR